MDFDSGIENGQGLFENVDSALVDPWQYFSTGVDGDSDLLAQYNNQGTFDIDMDLVAPETRQFDFCSNKTAIGFSDMLSSSSVDNNWTDYFSRPRDHAVPPLAGLTMCRCLERHAVLIIRLNELIKSDLLPLDAVLNGVQEGLSFWHEFMECAICKADQDHETIALCAMTMRAVLRLLHKSVLEASTLGCQKSGVTTPGGTHFSIGSYLIQGDERLVILKILYSKMLSQTRAALQCLEERVGTMSAIATLDSQLSSIPTSTMDVDSLILQHLLGGIHKRVRSLSALVESAGVYRLPASPQV